MAAQDTNGTTTVGRYLLDRLVQVGVTVCGLHPKVLFLIQLANVRSSGRLQPWISRKSILPK